jgi:hypothetical protein
MLKQPGQVPIKGPPIPRPMDSSTYVEQVNCEWLDKMESLGYHFDIQQTPPRRLFRAALGALR